VARRLAAGADVVAENFKPGTMRKYGLDYASLSAVNERIIYVSLKGFLPGPYENRTALDEVVQMMGGLAYMTGRPGDPLRAGTSVNDIMGGMFGAIGVLGALIQRGISGKGPGSAERAVREQRVPGRPAHAAIRDHRQPAAPMPDRISAWAVYDVFTVKDGGQVFLAVVSDAQWKTFCTAFGFDDLLADAGLATNNQRVLARASLMPVLRERLAPLTVAELGRRFEQLGLPYAPIRKPEELYDDAPAPDRRPGRHRIARRRSRRADGRHHAAAVHDARPAPRRARATAARR
jgi:crotonobetainyl-CoA:carnitine CoA-transferase CaiB-like acyl-CoA transferase